MLILSDIGAIIAFSGEIKRGLGSVAMRGMEI